MKFNHLVIAKKLRLSTAISLIVLFALGFFGLYQLNLLNRASEEIHFNRMPSNQYLAEVKAALANHRMKAYKHISLDGIEEHSVEEGKMRKYLEIVDTNLKLFGTLASTKLERVDLAILEEQISQYKKTNQDILALSRQNLDVEACAIIYAASFQEFENLNSTLSKLTNFNLEQSQLVSSESEGIFKRGMLFICFVTIGFCILVFLLGRVIISGITSHFKLLALSEAKFRAILESSSDANFFLDKDYRVLSLNRAAVHRIKSIFKKEIKVGDHFLEFVIFERRQDFISNFKQAFAGGEVMEEHNFAIEGDTVWFRRYYYPVKDSESNILGVAINSENITEQKHAEQQIKNQLEKLTEISFIQSHKVRGPVATLLGLSTLFNHKNPQDEINAAVVEKMDITVKDLDRVVREIVLKTY